VEAYEVWAAVRIAPFERNHVRFAPDQKQRKLLQEATLEEQRVLFDVTCFDVCWRIVCVLSQLMYKSLRVMQTFFASRSTLPPLRADCRSWDFK